MGKCTEKKYILFIWNRIVTATPSPHTQNINCTKNSLTFSSGFIFISTMHGFLPAVKWLMCKSFGGYTSAGDNFSLQNFSLKRFFLPWHIQYIQSQSQTQIQIYTITNTQIHLCRRQLPPPKLFLRALVPALTAPVSGIQISEALCISFNFRYIPFWNQCGMETRRVL